MRVTANDCCPHLVDHIPRSLILNGKMDLPRLLFVFQIDLLALNNCDLLRYGVGILFIWNLAVKIICQGYPTLNFAMVYIGERV